MKLFRPLAAIAIATAANAQSTIRGVVRDSARVPMPNVDVRAIPSAQRARTDSTGTFAFTGLDAGRYVLRVRRIGYAPVEWTVDVAKGGRADVQIEMGPRLAQLDTVRVVGTRSCDAKSYEGFLCRRTSAKGVFLDYDDIDTAQVYWSADLLRDVGGFTTTVTASRDGPTRIPSSKACTIVLMNGVPTPWSSIPDAPYMISAIEVYKSPRDIPAEFRRYTWGKERCWLVAYWTYDFMMKPIRKVKLPYRFASDR